MSSEIIYVNVWFNNERDPAVDKMVPKIIDWKGKLSNLPEF